MPQRQTAKRAPGGRGVKRTIAFNFLRGERQDFASETNLSYSKEFVCWDASAAGQKGENMAVTADGYEMVTFVPCQSNPDGVGTGRRAGTASIMAYQIPGVQGTVFGVVCNGGGTEFDDQQGRWLSVHNTLWGCQPPPTVPGGCLEPNGFALTDNIYTSYWQESGDFAYTRPLDLVNYMSIAARDSRGRYWTVKQMSGSGGSATQPVWMNTKCEVSSVGSAPFDKLIGSRLDGAIGLLDGSPGCFFVGPRQVNIPPSILVPIVNKATPDGVVNFPYDTSVLTPNWADPTIEITACGSPRASGMSYTKEGHLVVLYHAASYVNVPTYGRMWVTAFNVDTGATVWNKEIIFVSEEYYYISGSGHYPIASTPGSVPSLVADGPSYKSGSDELFFQRSAGCPALGAGEAYGGFIPWYSRGWGCASGGLHAHPNGRHFFYAMCDGSNGEFWALWEVDLSQDTAYLLAVPHNISRCGITVGSSTAGIVNACGADPAVVGYQQESGMFQNTWGIAISTEGQMALVNSGSTYPGATTATRIWIFDPTSTEDFFGVTRTVFRLSGYNTLAVSTVTPAFSPATVFAHPLPGYFIVGGASDADTTQPSGSGTGDQRAQWRIFDGGGNLRATLIGDDFTVGATTYTPRVHSYNNATLRDQNTLPPPESNANANPWNRLGYDACAVHLSICQTLVSENA